MDIYPAIDLKDGRVVRLTRGDYDTAEVYADDPAAVARSFAEKGARLRRSSSGKTAALWTNCCRRCKIEQIPDTSRKRELQ